MFENVYFSFSFHSRSTIVMDEKRHNGGRDGSIGGDSKIVSLLETERSRLSGSDRGFAEGDRRRKSIAFRPGDGGTGRSQRFAQIVPFILCNFIPSYISVLLPVSCLPLLDTLALRSPFLRVFLSVIERSIPLVNDGGKRQGSSRFDSETKRCFTCHFTCSTDTNGNSFNSRCSAVESRSEESRGDKSSSIHEHRFESDFVAR